MFVIASTALIAIPLAYFFMKDHPLEYYGMLPDGDHLKKKDDD